MFHLLVYSGSVAQNASLANVPTVVDEVIPVYANNVYGPPADQLISRYYARGDSATQFRFDSPNLRPIGPPHIYPFDTAAEPPNLPPIRRPDNAGLRWMKDDPLAVLCSRAGAGASVCQAALWITPGRVAPIEANVIPVRATASITLTTTTWVSGTLTFDQSLPPGKYKVVGMAAFGTDLLFVRLVFPNQVPRPGVLAQDSAGEYEWEQFRNGQFGEFGEFTNTAPPVVQAMGLAAGAQTVNVYLDLVPVNVPIARY